MTFTIEDGMGGTEEIDSGDILTIPSDMNFYNLRFVYNHNSGLAEVFYEGNSVWTYFGTPRRKLVWTGDNMIVGVGTNGAGESIPVIDNLIIREIETVVPTLSQWGVIILGICLAIFGTAGVSTKVHAKIT